MILKAKSKNKIIELSISNGTQQEFFDIIEELKENIAPQERQFIPEKKTWDIHYSIDNIKSLYVLGFDLDDELFNVIHKENDAPWKNIVVPDKYSILRDYQKETFRFVKYGLNGEGSDIRKLISLDVGLGKTLVSLCIADSLRNSKTLIICPAIVKYGWAEEIEKWPVFRRKKVYVADSAKKLVDPNADICIINYELIALNIFKNSVTRIDPYTDREYSYNTFKMTQQIKEINDIHFDFLIIDEVQYIKNKNQTSEGVIKIGKRIPDIIGLSATPFDNKASELYNLLHLLRPDNYYFKTKDAYLNRYCFPKQSLQPRKWGMVEVTTYDGVSNAAELHATLKKDIMIRYKQEEVWKDMPKKNIIPVPWKSSVDFKSRKRELIEAAKKGKDTTALKTNINLEIWEEKKDRVFELIENLLECTEKVFVFYFNKQVAYDLQDHFEDLMLRIDGDSTAKEKREIKDKFIKRKKYRVLGGNYDSAGTGLNGIQEVCNYMVVVQNPYTPTKLRQMWGRIMRIGQEKPCFYYHPVLTNSLESDMIRFIDEKLVQIDAVMDGKETDEEDFLTWLIKKEEEESESRQVEI